MNFDIDYRHVNIVAKSPRTVPVLVLIREWGRLKQDPYSQTEVIQLILEGIQPLANFEEGLGFKDISDSIPNAELKNAFLKSFGNVLDDLMAFMDLFDDLNGLLVPSDKTGTPLLDVDCSNNIMSTYVRQCVLEYKKVTFSQIMRFHSSLQNYFRRESDGRNHQNTSQNTDELTDTSESGQLYDFASKLRDLVLLGGDMNELAPSNSNFKIAPHRMGLGSEALQLAELHGKFGHSKEGLLALEEAIRLAQQNQNLLLLEHALAWLLKLESFNPKGHLVMLKKFVKNADDLKLPLLGIWGRLQQVKTLIQMSESPQKVLQTLITSEVDHLSSQDEADWKGSLHVSGLTLLATTWDHYGHRLLALHYAQLVCHMTSCDRNPEEDEAVALSVSILARHLQITGHVEKSLLLLSASISLFKNKGLPFKILSKCEQEIRFDRAIEEGDILSARKHLSHIQSLDKGEGLFRSAVLLRREGRLSEAVNIVMEAIRKSNDMKVSQDLHSRYLQLLCDMESAPSKSLLHVVECLALSEKSHLSQFSVKLRQSLIMLQLRCPRESLNLLNEVSLQVLSNGSLSERGQMHSLMAQAILSQSQEDKAPLLKENILAVLPLLTQAVADLRECSSTHQLKNTLSLQAHFYDYIGYISKRNETSKLFVELQNGAIPCV